MPVTSQQIDPQSGKSDSPIVKMYRSHPFPGRHDKVEFADKRMQLRLYSCGVQPEDYSGGRVLDAGCGTGEYACWFASERSDVSALDLSAEALEQARRYAQRHNLDGISFHEGSVLDLPFDTESFDVVYCTGVLHHTPAPHQGFKELCRVARPGGKILISLYHSWGFLPRSFRWNIVRLLGGDDLDQRVAWGRFLFPLVSSKLVDEDLADPEALLYDHFAAPQQSTHRMREVLQWFNESGLKFQGTFPPARPSDYPALFQHDGYQSIEKELRSPLHDLVSRIGDAEMSRQSPNPIERLLVETLWLLAGVDIFSACGMKPSESPAR